ncbi:MAG: hypothetical protein ACRD1R_21555 [Acidobacteriota bacterium]
MLAMFIYLLLTLLLPLAPSGASKVNQVLTQLKESTGRQTYVLTESEINAFAAAAIESKKRLGVKKVVFDLKPGGKFTATAQINMDDVELTGLTFRMFQALLSGTQTLQAQGKFSADKGRGLYELESASFNSITVPAFLVNAVLSYLSKRQPPHIDITEPFDLPYGVRQVSITSNRLTITR